MLTTLTTLTMQTAQAEAPGASALQSLAWWHWLLLGLLLAALLVALIWAIVAWRRRRLAAAPTKPAGPSLSSYLPRLWRPFYRRIPARARHFPTVVVMGAAGVGKTHAISSHVDWRGQANQFRRSVHHDAALQLYLGPNIIVHELSGPLLRDVSGGARVALWRMWRRMGPSATVVLVLDARTLLTTPPAALRELAQLVRGKIGLFPLRCQASLEVRVLLSHVDQIDGFEAFAGVAGADHEPLDLEALGPEPRDAARLVADFDAHLAYALTTRSGEAFDHLVRFYASLGALLSGLWPLLVTLRGRDEPHAAPLQAGGLYLGSLTPRSHVGKPFRISEELITASIGRHHQRGLRGALAVMACGFAAVAGLTEWHRTRIADAEALMAELKDRIALATEAKDCEESKPTEAEMHALTDEAAAIHAYKDSQHLWLTRAWVERKRLVQEGFETEIRYNYLYPKLRCSRDRLQLHYVMALIYASHGNELGAIINTRDNRALWARELKLSEEVIRHYIEASSPDMSGVTPEEPEGLAALGDMGREWSQYLEDLQAKLDPIGSDPVTITAEEASELRRRLPPLLTPDEYTVLMDVREAFKRAKRLRGKFEQLLVVDPIDLWTEEQYETLRALKEALRDHLPWVGRGTDPASTSGWGLGDLVTALRDRPPAISEDFAIKVHHKPVALKGSALSALIDRSRSHLLVTEVLPKITAGRGEGAAFFHQSDRFAPAGVVAGYGGRATESIRGHYTKDGYVQRVAPVLRHAAERLAPALRDPDGDAFAALGMTLADATDLDREILAQAKQYADAYQLELLEYYKSMELDPATEFTLPFVLQAFTQSSSWFVDFLRAVADNAALDLPADDPYVAPLAKALVAFKPLVDLLASKDGEIPGLGPYRKILATLEPALGGAPEAHDGAELHHRLTPLGNSTLAALQQPGSGFEAQVEQWLEGAGLSEKWHAPFLAPVEEAHRLGIDNIDTEVKRAWKDEVRPIVRPILAAYPFSPAAAPEVDVDEMEAVVRAQGKDPGTFWTTFDRLVGPATTRIAGARDMLPGLDEPAGLLAMTGDLERTSRILWDADGKRVPLKVVLAPLVLPKEPHEDRLAAMAYVRSGGAAVYGFNQRQDPQTLNLQWWNQGISVVSLEMRPAVTSLGPRTTTIEEDGPFSFYRLLDRAETGRFPRRRPTLTEMAIERATRCPPGQNVGSKPLTLVWSVSIGETMLTTRDVRMVLQSDPWLAFSVRNCGG
jgi:hypothetical protein